MTAPVTYGAPGVGVQWVSASRPVPFAARTDVAGFVGFAARGPAHVPVRIRSWSQFRGVFGPHGAGAWLAHAVEGFFANGGDACWVVRVVDPGRAAPATARLPGRPARPAALATATSVGTWARGTRLVVRSDGGRFSLTVDAPTGREDWPDLGLDPARDRYAPDVVNDDARGSRAVRLDVPVGAAVGVGEVRMTGGDDGLASVRAAHLVGDGTPTGLRWGLAALDPVSEVALVAVPDALSRDDVRDLQTAVLHSCARRRRFALLDVPDAGLQPDAAVAWAAALARNDTDAAFGALVYPWVRVADPAGAPGSVLDVPTCGHVAGVVARTDRATGVHRAPANETVVGALDAASVFDDAVRARLNDASVDAIDVRPGRGVRLMGARTLSADPAWRYTNVRRLVSMVELALEAALAWIVFEPHSTALAAEVEREVRAFLTALWQRGALDGARVEDALTVRCDPSTTTAQDVDAGRLVCEIGLRPPVPAEFVTVRLAVSEAGVQVLGEQGRQVPSTPGGPDAG